MSAYGCNFGGAGNMFHDLPSPISDATTDTITATTTTYKLNPIVLYHFNLHLPVANRSSLLGRTCAQSQLLGIPSTREARYHIPKRERQEDRTFLAFSGDRAADAVWLGGVDLGKYHRINIQCADGEKHGLFRSCCLFFLRHATKCLKFSFLVFPS